MRDKLLNEKSFFQCNGNLLISITAEELNNQVAKDKRNKILTDKAKCKVISPLPCNILSSGGTPVMCQIKQTVWEKTSTKMRCNGRPVLTTKSRIKCICGGEIKPISSVCISAIGSDITDYSYTGNYQSTDKESNFNDNKRGNEKQTGKESKRENVDDKEKETAYVSYILCDYENCDERSTCGYFNSPIFVINDSIKLSKNFQRLRKDEWNIYEAKHNKKLMESSEGNWSIAAHHIISGNQVLMMKKGNIFLFGHMIKLANYFHYDINNAINCIMLPTNAGNFGEKSPIGKTANAYEVMQLMGRQWHVGGYKYSLSKDILKILEDYYKKYPQQCLKSGNGAIFTDYATAVKEELDKLEMKYSRPRCWKKNYEKKKQKFIDDMNSLSAKIEKHLLDFERNPKESFPFYVSKISLEYAFNLPSTIKVIVLYKENMKLRAKKVRMERYKKDGLKIIPKERGDIEICDIKSFAVFCENAMFFIIDQTINAVEQEQYCFQNIKTEDARPEIWKTAFKQKDLQRTDVMKYLIEHRNELFAFIQQKEVSYQPIARIVSVRGG